MKCIVCKEHQTICYIIPGPTPSGEPICEECQERREERKKELLQNKE